MVKVSVLPFVNQPEFIKHPRWPTPMIPAVQSRLPTCYVCGRDAIPTARLGGWVCGTEHSPQEVEEAIERGKKERDAAAAKHPESPEG